MDDTQDRQDASPDAGADRIPVADGKRRPRKRIAVYATLLGVLGAVFAANAVQVHALERELEAVAEERVAEFKAEEPPESLASLKIGYKVVVTKAYLLFGDVSGKAGVYLQHGGDSPDQSLIEGFEFFFVREPDGAWRQTESGRCTSDECTQEGLRVLRKLDRV